MICRSPDPDVSLEDIVGDHQHVLHVALQKDETLDFFFYPLYLVLLNGKKKCFVQANTC